MKNQVPKTVVNVSPGKFADLEEVKNALINIEEKIKPSEKKWRTQSRLKYVAIILIIIVAAYALRGFWLAPIIKSKLENLLGRKFHSEVQIGLVDGNYFNYFELYNVGLNESDTNSDSQFNKISIYFSFWKMLSNDPEWIKIIKIDDGKLDVNLEDYLRSGKPLKLPRSLPALSFNNIDLSINLDGLELEFTEFNCTLWSSGRIIANAEILRGNFSDYTFNKSSFEFDARWLKQQLGIDKMTIAGQNIANDFVLDFSKGKNGIVGMLGQLLIDQSQVFIDAGLELTPQKQSTLTMNKCQFINFDLQPLYSLLQGFPIKQGEISGEIKGIVNLDLFTQSDFEYDIEITDAKANDIEIPVLSGKGSFSQGILKVINGNWVQSYKSANQRRLQTNSLELDISGLQEGKLRAIEGEIVLYSDEHFALLKNLTSKSLPDAQYLLKAVFKNNEILIFGNLKDDYGNLINVNRFLVSYNSDEPINLKNLNETTLIETDVDFNIKHFERFVQTFPEIKEFINFSGRIDGRLLAKGTSEQGKAKITLNIKNLMHKNLLVADSTELSAFVDWDKSGKTLKINTGKFVRGVDIAFIEGSLRVPNTETTYSEIITENLESINLFINIADLKYYSSLFDIEDSPSGSCNLSLVSQPFEGELGVLSANINNFRYGKVKLDEFKVNSTIYRDKVNISEISGSNEYGLIRGSMSANYANQKHIILTINSLNYYFEGKQLTLLQEIDSVIKEDKISINSLEMGGTLGEISLSVLTILKEGYFDIDYKLNELDGSWIHKIADNNYESDMTFGKASFQGSFKGTTSGFESNVVASITKISIPEIPQFNIDYKCDATHEIITFSDVSIVDFTKHQKRPLVKAEVVLPLNIFEFAGIRKVENRILGLDNIYAKVDLDLDNLTWLQAIIPDNARPAGKIKASINVSGTFSAPEAEASISLNNLDFTKVEDKDFLSFFNLKNVITKSFKQNTLKNYKDCSSKIELTLKDKKIDINKADFILSSGETETNKDSVLDEIELSGEVELVGDLTDVILMQDKFSIGEGTFDVKGQIEDVSKFPLINSILKDIEGNLSFDFSISSPWVAPRFNGKAEFTKGTAQFLNDIHSVNELSAKFVFEDRLIYMQNLTGNSGGALLKGDGQILLKDSDINLNLNIYGDSILLKRTQNQVLRGDVNLKILKSYANPKIQGEIKIIDSEYSDYFNVFSEIEVIDLGNTSGIFASSELDIKITNTSDIDVNTIFIKGKASVNLNINGTVEKQIVSGKIIIKDATLLFPALKFFYPRITLRFNSDNDDIRISGTGAGSEFGYSVEMKLGGIIGEPEFFVKSKPAAGNDEILSMIIFGKRPAKIQPGQGIAPVQKITLFVPKELLDRIFTIKNQNKDVVLERMEVKEFTNYSKNDRELFLLRFYLASGSDDSSETFAVELERDKYDTLNMGLAFIIRFK